MRVPPRGGLPAGHPQGVSCSRWVRLQAPAAPPGGVLCVARPVSNPAGEFISPTAGAATISGTLVASRDPRTHGVRRLTPVVTCLVRPALVAPTAPHSERDSRDGEQVRNRNLIFRRAQGGLPVRLQTQGRRGVALREAEEHFGHIAPTDGSSVSPPRVSSASSRIQNYRGLTCGNPVAIWAATGSVPISPARVSAGSGRNGPHGGVGTGRATHPTRRRWAAGDETGTHREHNSHGVGRRERPAARRGAHSREMSATSRDATPSVRSQPNECHSSIAFTKECDLI